MSCRWFLLGGGCGVGIGLGWGWGIAIGAEYIDVKVDFADAKIHRPHPLKALEQQVQKVFAPKPKSPPSHQIVAAELPPPHSKP